MIIEVAFKGNRKEFFLWESEAPPPTRAGVIVEADRGEDLGHVHSTGDLALQRNAGAAHGTGEAGPSKKAHRLATSDEEVRLQEVRGQDEDARRKAMERVRANQLAMKLSDAEWQWDRKKLTFFFTAEKRVDFRNLVRELAAMFRTRIELKQIGVRDEAKRLDGIGRCGRQYCSSSWLPELRPVNLGVAKDQRLSLNPSQISGACGRLMCCLRYEHEFYVQQRKRFPKEGKVLHTARGEEKVVANDIFRERVTLRGTDNEFRVITLAELRAELAQTGGDSPSAEAILASEAQAEPMEVDEGLEEAAPDREAGTMPPARSGSPGARRNGGRVAGRQHRERPPQEGSSPVPASAPVSSPAPAAERTTPPVAPAATSQAPVTEGQETGAESESEQRKPHRRRGRRGGRRNRARDGGQGDGAARSPSAGDDS